MNVSFSSAKNRPVAIWLLIGIFMIMVQVLLGGITRLTGSGLSITEWKPLLGALPPMNESAWQQAFDQYKQLAQFRYLNNHFTLADFKFIYWWEWLHREWARLMGVVFFVPFVYFIIRKKMDRSLVNPMILLFLLGGLQGLVGWIMVKSGLNDENLYVSHLRLAIHFVAALILLCYTWWFAMRLLVKEEQLLPNRLLRSYTVLIIAVLVLQMIYGAFMAGLHAALSAATWPTINGRWIPDHLLASSSFFNAITHNTLTVQFIHRGLAYLLTALIVIWWWKAGQHTGNSLLYRYRHVPLAVVLAQVILGILTVVSSQVQIPLLYGVMHQLVGMLLLMVMVGMRYLCSKKTASI